MAPCSIRFQGHQSSRRLDIAVGQVATPTAFGLGHDAPLRANFESQPIEVTTEGTPVRRTVALAARVVTSWDMFRPTLPSAPVPDELRSGQAGIVVPAPGMHAKAEYPSLPGANMEAVAVDVYYAKGHPYWPSSSLTPDEKVGLLRNSAGDYITAVVRRDFFTSLELPDGLYAGSVVGHPTALRGISSAVDARGTVTFAETWRAPAMQAAGSAKLSPTIDHIASSTSGIPSGLPTPPASTLSATPVITANAASRP